MVELKKYGQAGGAARRRFQFSKRCFRWLSRNPAP